MKYRTVTKHPKKVMLWMTISEKGVSRQMFVQKKTVLMVKYIEKVHPNAEEFH